MPSLARRVAALAAALLLAAPAFVSAGSAQCSPGSFNSSSGKAPCTLCPAGTYQPNSGQTSCRKAQSGWFASGSGPNGSGATAQSICKQGTFSPLEGSASCTICPAGSYCNGQGQTRSELCPPGHFSPTPGLGQQCYECPKGTFTSARGATQCCSCCAGFYTDQTAQDHPFPCPVRGAFSPIGATSAQQCGSKPGGGLLQCSMSGDKCPDGGSSPTGGVHRRDVRRRACPVGHKSCPLYGSTLRGRGYLRGYECVDVQNDLESCGGCVADDSPFGGRTADGGRDCSAIPNVDSVSCRAGNCVIAKCITGYVLSASGEACVPSLFAQDF